MSHEVVQRQILNMTRRGPAKADPRQYIQIRIDQLKEERAKNTDVNTHMILDKAIFELTEVLMLLERGTE